MQSTPRTEVKYIDQGKYGTTKVIIKTPGVADVDEARRNTESQCRAFEAMLSNVFGGKWKVSRKDF